MKIIVTGGAGFIGSHLVEFLIKKGHSVIVIDNLSTGNIDNIKNFRKKIRFIRADISKKGKWEKEFKNVHAVYHIAALADIVPSIENPEKYFNSNVVGTKNILQACIKNRIKKIIYSASSSCYGIPINYPTKETEKIDCRYPYALTKWIGEKLLLHYGKVYNLNVISLRLFNVYGTRSRTSGTYGAMFGVFLAQILNKKPLTVVGNGKQKRDFIYVSDVANAFYKCLNYNKKNMILNVGTGKPISVIKIAKILKSKVIYIQKRPGEPERTHANISKIKKELNWKPTIKIEDGINKLLININYWKKAPIWTPKKIKVATKSWFKYLK